MPERLHKSELELRLEARGYQLPKVPTVFIRGGGLKGKIYLHQSNVPSDRSMEEVFEHRPDLRDAFYTPYDNYDSAEQAARQLNQAITELAEQGLL